MQRRAMRGYFRHYWYNSKFGLKDYFPNDSGGRNVRYNQRPEGRSLITYSL